jgi:stage V sporulation protein G
MKMVEVVKLHRNENSSALKAFADVVFNEQILVKGMRIIEGRSGLFITMPQIRGKDRKWYPTTMLLDENLKEEVQEALFEAYNA